MSKIFYSLGKSLYVNVTNKCTNSCVFCIREHSGVGYDLWFDSDPTSQEMINELDQVNLNDYDEVVFCGYGEPLIRYREVLELAKEIKKRKDIPVRINTNGHANAYHNQDITPLFSGLIDCISISLNAVDAKKYQKICVSQYGENGFFYMLDFTKKCKAFVPEVILSVVDEFIDSADIPKAQEIADSLGVKFRVRQFSG